MTRENPIKSRISDAQKQDLIERRTTYAALARELNCSQSHLSRLFPKRKPKETQEEIAENKRILAKCRRDYRESLAKSHLLGEYSLVQVSKLANVSTRHMRRIIKDVQDKT